MVRFPFSAVLIAAACAAAGAAGATQQRLSAAGLQYVSGGVTAQETAAIAAARRRYSLALFARSSVSGGPLVDAHVRIVGADDKLLLDTDMDGPWLLAALAPGRYRIEVTFQDETQRREVDIPANGRRELTLDFRSDAEVSLNTPR